MWKSEPSESDMPESSRLWWREMGGCEGCGERRKGAAMKGRSGRGVKSDDKRRCLPLSTVVAVVSTPLAACGRAVGIHTGPAVWLFVLLTPPRCDRRERTTIKTNTRGKAVPDTNASVCAASFPLRPWFLVHFATVEWTTRRSPQASSAVAATMRPHRESVDAHNSCCHRPTQLLDHPTLPSSLLGNWGSTR